jgi:hypothetical protein
MQKLQKWSNPQSLKVNQMSKSVIYHNFLLITLFTGRPNTALYQRIEQCLLPQERQNLRHVCWMSEWNILQHDGVESSTLSQKIAMLLVRQCLQNYKDQINPLIFYRLCKKLTTKSPLLLAQSREPDEQFLVIRDIIGC